MWGFQGLSSIFLAERSANQHPLGGNKAIMTPTICRSRCRNPVRVEMILGDLVRLTGTSTKSYSALSVRPIADRLPCRQHHSQPIVLATTALFYVRKDFRCYRASFRCFFIPLVMSLFELICSGVFMHLPPKRAQPRFARPYFTEGRGGFVAWGKACDLIQCMLGRICVKTIHDRGCDQTLSPDQ